MFTPVRPPFVVKRFYHRFVWEMPAVNKNIYLTFDDGPVPEATDFVLQQLEKYRAPATFFCIGDNVKKHPAIFQEIKNAGHRIGNHTQHHLNGWENNTENYIKDVNEAAKFVSSELFRPPYGRIRKQQANLLLEKYKIIMWDVISYDYDKRVTPEKCYQNVITNTRPGSIIVFHDSVKAFKNITYALPKCLEYFQSNGFIFKNDF